VPAHTTRAWPSPTVGSAAVSQQYAQQYAPQQRKQQAQQQAQQQRRLDTNYGRKGRKRSYRDSDESSRSESGTLLALWCGKLMLQEWDARVECNSGYVWYAVRICA
jgi:hypothetical protein